MVTIADVARRAGVAPSTVSYVLTNRRSISPATRKVVEQAIEELDYRPHAGARSLRGSRTRVLALSGADASGPYRASSAQFVHHVAKAARGYDHDLLLLTAQEGVQGIRRIAGSRLADAAVLMSVLTDDPRIPVLRKLRFPGALIGKPRTARGLSWCDFDFENASAIAIRELASAGHRTVGFIASSDSEFRRGMNYAARALSGARAAARETDVRLHVARASRAHQTMVKRIRALLDCDPAPTAIVTHHELPLLTSILRDLGYVVPTDVSVVMVGSTPGSVTEIPLARLDLPIEHMASTTVDLAIHAIDAEGEPSPESGRLIPARLIHGKSIAPPPV